MNTNKKFLNPEAVLFNAGLKAGQTVGDLGVGSGHYALAAAKIVGSHGTVHAVDVKDSALDHVAAEARTHGHKTIRTHLCNLDQPKCKLPESDCDLVVVANILHEMSDRKTLLKHAYGMLKSGGRMVVVDWNDKPGPIGPAADRRVSEETARKEIESSSFKHVKNLDTDGYHYAMVFER